MKNLPKRIRYKGQIYEAVGSSKRGFTNPDELKIALKKAFPSIEWDGEGASSDGRMRDYVLETIDSFKYNSRKLKQLEDWLDKYDVDYFYENDLDDNLDETDYLFVAIYPRNWDKDGNWISRK